MTTNIAVSRVRRALLAWPGLLALPAFPGCPQGAVMALGSASRASRMTAAWLALDDQGLPGGRVHRRDLHPLLVAVQGQVGDLNIEGGFVQRDRLCLLQRGNGDGGVNACVHWHWPAVGRWLGGLGAPPLPLQVQRYELGAIDGVSLSFTDGAALPDGGWLFSAAAEDTRDTYADGPCAGSVLGLVDASGELRRLQRLAPVCKVEGVAVSSDALGLDVLLVTDADDRRQPARLLSLRLPC